jgi:phosphonopyruvate decarboxylase
MFIEDLFNLLIKKNIDNFYGVPDSLLKDFNSFIEDKPEIKSNIITANEGNAIGYAIGSYLATGNISCVYLQNSGLGNTINPLLSLADDNVMGIPILMIIGWRGHPYVSDEPQHKKQGAITPQLLDTMGISYVIIDNNDEDYVVSLSLLIENIKKNNRPGAIIVKKNCLQLKNPAVNQVNETHNDRESCIKHIVDTLGKEPVYFSTTGYPSRELYEYINEKPIPDEYLAFYCVGGMGHVSSIAAGFSLNNPRKTVCIDGDGSLIMHMGSLGVIASQSLPRFIHIVFNNGCHESVGGQPTVASDINLSKVAAASGYKKYLRFNTADDFIKNCSLINTESSLFIEIVIEKGTRSNLGRPKQSPKQNIHNLKKYLLK